MFPVPSGQRIHLKCQFKLKAAFQYLSQHLSELLSTLKQEVASLSTLLILLILLINSDILSDPWGWMQPPTKLQSLVEGTAPIMNSSEFLMHCEIWTNWHIDKFECCELSITNWNYLQHFDNSFWQLFFLWLLFDNSFFPFLFEVERWWWWREVRPSDSTAVPNVLLCFFASRRAQHQKGKSLQKEKDKETYGKREGSKKTFFEVKASRLTLNLLSCSDDFPIMKRYPATDVSRVAGMLNRSTSSLLMFQHDKVC